MIRYKSFWAVVWFIATLFTSQNVFAETAREVVEKFQADLIDVMKHGKELGYEGRYKKLADSVAKSHDLTKIARIVIGKEWQDLSEAQQQKMIDVFSQLSIASYAYNFKDYAGESFRFDSQEETGRGGVILHYYLVVPKEKEVRFDYMLKEKGDTWQINNIIANGVSDLALKRSEYGSILKREGFDALIAKINDKISQYSKQ